jgi:hypothetical protein
MGTVIALDLLSTHPEFFSIDSHWWRTHWSSFYIWKSFTWSYRFAFIWDFSQSLAKSYIEFNFFKQIGLEKNLWLLLVLQKPTLLLKSCWNLCSNFNNKWSKDLVLGTGQKVYFTQWKVFRNQRCNSFSLATEREVHLSSIQYLLENS